MRLTKSFKHSRIVVTCVIILLGIVERTSSEVITLPMEQAAEIRGGSWWCPLSECISGGTCSTAHDCTFDATWVTCSPASEDVCESASYKKCNFPAVSTCTTDVGPGGCGGKVRHRCILNQYQTGCESDTTPLNSSCAKDCT
jgi:hypothetical protein